jgi:glutathionylspermidine synthase
MDTMKINSVSADVEFVSFYDLKVDNDGILLPDGRHAAAIYRLHPMEILIEETATDGTDLGVLFLEKYAEGKFAMFNPPEAVIMQNKAFMALVWQIYLTGKYFNSSESAIIKKYMLPSYFEDDFHVADGGEYIKKPIWGREGRNISIVDGSSKNIIYNHEVDAPEEVVCRESEKFMYQKFVHTPKFEAITDGGHLSGYTTFSCFMLANEPSAVYCRFSQEKIIGTEAYFVPLVVE